MARIALRLSVMLVVSIGGPALAGISPSLPFGSLPQANFNPNGPSGIPNDAVAITTIDAGGNTITLGLTAHQRYSNPPLSNDGAGTFAAQPGSNFGGPGNPSTTEGALWNFAYYINVSSGTVADYRFELLYDADPGVGTDESAHGVFDISTTAAVLSISDESTLENSENLLFGAFRNGISGFITPPSTPFDPNISGSYSFSLRAYSLTSDALLGQSNIVVNVGDVAAVPEPTTLAGGLLGVALVAGGFWLRRRRGR